MKNSITFLLIIFIFSFVDTQAQKNDSLVKPPLMKSKSQIFIAEIKTDEGVKKGILYDANEQEVIILDSAYQKMAIQVSGIKSIVLRRSNALWFGFRTVFLSTEAFTLLLTLAASKYALSVFATGTIFALFAGGTFLLLSAIPSMSIRVDTPQDYIEKLNPLHRHSQVYLIKQKDPKLRMKT
jgi:hypothetical protein